MRYYYYGNSSKKELEIKEEKKTDLKQRLKYAGELIIEDDTVYEIDQDCVRCQKKNND